MLLPDHRQVAPPRARECRIDVTVRLPELNQKMLVLFLLGDDWSSQAQRTPTVRDDRKRIILDSYKSGGVFSDVSPIRNHHSDSLAHKRNFIFGRHKSVTSGGRLGAAKL